MSGKYGPSTLAVGLCLLCGGGLLSAWNGAYAQPLIRTAKSVDHGAADNSSKYEPKKRQANKNIVMTNIGQTFSTYLKLGADRQDMFDDRKRNALRILPIDGIALRAEPARPPIQAAQVKNVACLSWIGSAI
jgi:hypothetical protein